MDFIIELISLSFPMNYGLKQWNQQVLLLFPNNKELLVNQGLNYETKPLLLILSTNYELNICTKSSWLYYWSEH